MDYVHSRINSKFVHPTSVRSISVECYGNGYLMLCNASMLSVLWDLHTLVITNYERNMIILLPLEIWDMPQLRYLVVSWGVLPHPVVDCMK